MQFSLPKSQDHQQVKITVATVKGHRLESTYDETFLEATLVPPDGCDYDDCEVTANFVRNDGSLVKPSILIKAHVAKAPPVDDAEVAAKLKADADQLAAELAAKAAEVDAANAVKDAEPITLKPNAAEIIARIDAEEAKIDTIPVIVTNESLLPVKRDVEVEVKIDAKQVGRELRQALQRSHRRGVNANVAIDQTVQATVVKAAEAAIEQVNEKPE